MPRKIVLNYCGYRILPTKGIFSNVFTFRKSFTGKKLIHFFTFFFLSRKTYISDIIYLAFFFVLYLNPKI